MSKNVDDSRKNVDHILETLSCDGLEEFAQDIQGLMKRAKLSFNNSCREVEYITFHFLDGRFFKIHSIACSNKMIEVLSIIEITNKECSDGMCGTPAGFTKGDSNNN